jgi:hypothetical protein
VVYDTYGGRKDIQEKQYGILIREDMENIFG